MMYGWNGFPGVWGLHMFGIVGIIALVIHVLWIAALAFGIYLLVRALTRNSMPPRPMNRHEGEEFRILRQRYARGEINAEEYQRIRDDLIKDQH